MSWGLWTSSDLRVFRDRPKQFKTRDNKIDGVPVVLLNTDLIHRAMDDARKSGDALQRSESTVRALLESAAQAILAVNADGRVVLANRMMEKMFGYNQEELLAQPLRKGIHPDDRDRVQRTVEEAMRPESRGQYATEYRTIGANDGKERWISAWGRVHPCGGLSTGDTQPNFGRTRKPCYIA